MGMGQPLLGRTLGGRFQITGHIGEGAMASVFRGLDTQRPGLEIAIKVMHPHLAQDRTFTGRFKREAEAASRVQHPNSVGILQIGEEGGVHFIAMELCEGKDLRETLKVYGRLPPPRAVRIVATVCDALDAAHKLGVVHRDLKPENVMVLADPATGTDLVKVLDFGIAKIVDNEPKIRQVGDTDSDPPPALTQMGVVVGTPAYMSPEQCRGQPLDGRSDLYTCGILLYQLVTGRLPFQSESPIELAGKQAFEPPPPPSQHLPSLDRELEQIILQTLSKSAADRAQSALELRDVLNGWLDRHGGAGAPADGGLKGLSRTVPMSSVAATVKDYLRDNPPPPGLPQHLMPERGSLSDQFPTDANFSPDPGLGPGQAPSTGLFGPSPQDAFAPTFGQNTGPTPEQGYAAAPVFGAPAPQAAPVPQAPRGKKWGLVGFLLIMLSAAAGVGIGLGLFKLIG